MAHGRLLLHMEPSTLLLGNFVDFVQFDLVLGKLWSHGISCSECLNRNLFKTLKTRNGVFK